MSRRRRPFALTTPEQGWSSLLLLLGMLVLLGVSLADSHPLDLPKYGPLSGTLPVVMVAGGLIGYLLARSGLGVVRAHVLGAAVAAVMLLWITGAALLQRSPLPTDLEGISERIARVWMQLDTDIELLIADQITTSTVTVYLVLAALCWTTAQFGAFSVFRYDRGGPAVMAVGTILFLNVGLGSLQAQEELLPVLPVLALFAGQALLLLMRLQLVQQRYAWARRHISDTREVSQLFMRTGVVFVIIAVVGTSSLTAWATIDAQDVNVDAIDEPLQDVVEQLSDLFAFIGVPTGEDVPQPLGVNTRLSERWEPGEGTAFIAEVPGGLYGNYWWGKADNVYDYANGLWRTRPTGSQDVVEAGGQLRPSDAAHAGGRNRVQATLTIGDSPYARANLYRPPDADSSETHALRVRVTRGRGVSDMEYLAALDEGTAVRVTAFVRDYRPETDDLTANLLRSTAGTPYPKWVTDDYLHGWDDPVIVGPRTQAMADRISSERGSTPYDWASKVQDELRRMDYKTDILGRCDEFGGVFTECLLAIREGFCQQYATTMVMLMRAMRVPARFVTGYLPGEPDERGRLEVEQRALHNWVEVYFPEEGWIRFDPTPGIRFGQVPTQLREGELPGQGPSPTDEPLDEEFIGDLDTPPPTLEPDDAGGVVPADPSGGNGTGVFISLAAFVGLLVAVVSVMLLYRLRRLPDGDDNLAYLGIVSLATRLGYGPRPSQTEYEYASELSKTIPNVRADIYVVTDAQVQTSYGLRGLDRERRGLLRTAYARIRTALLRLSLRWRR